MASRNELLNDVEEAMRIALDGRQSSMWTAIPGIVAAVDLAAMTVSVQPSIQGTIELENGTIQSVNLPLLINVPIVFPSAGGFLITLPITQNNKILVIFSSRCIDAWWQNSGIQRPMETRMHDLSDGFAIPGPRSQAKLPAGPISSTKAQIRNNLGTSYVEIGADGKIGLVSPSEVDITAPVVNITSAAAAVTGALVVSGAVTAASFVTAGGVSLTAHTHSPGSLNAPSGGGPVTGVTGAPL